MPSFCGEFVHQVWHFGVEDGLIPLFLPYLSYSVAEYKYNIAYLN
jgi:hypothetical protein